LLFVNLEISYEHIPLIKLRKALEETRINPTFIETVKDTYKKSISYIKQGGFLSEGF
jgi:hypothetical protein